MRYLTVGEVILLYQRVMETFLVLNGYEIDASVDEQEQIILAVAAGAMKREAFPVWLTAHIVPRAEQAADPASSNT